MTTYPVRTKDREMQDLFDMADAVAGHGGSLDDRGKWQSLAGSLRSADFDEYRRSFEVIFCFPAATDRGGAVRQLNQMALAALKPKNASVRT